jgi:hypothetical protein
MTTYTDAMKQLKLNKRANCAWLVRWDAGDGFLGEGYWCDKRKRIITYVRTTDGHVII